jgi:hypothetical protein
MSQNEPMRPHEVLGIAKGASERDVRRAYRAILFDLEDTAQTDPEYPEKKRRLEEAFQACLAQAQPGEVLVPQTSDAPAKEPLSHKKLATRFAFGLLAIAALIFGFRWFQEFAVDPGGDSAVKTSGMIAAVEVLETGSRAVVFDADGKKTPVPGSGAKDTEAVWRPDGNRLMIVGDRGAGFEVFRWSPGSDSVQQRTRTARSKSALWFGPVGWPDLRDSGLLTSGGFVFEFDQRTGATRQLLPPVQGSPTVATGEDGGGVAQMDALYDSIGDSFLVGKWGKDRSVLWTTMAREEDEVFVLNPMVADINEGRPAPLIAGKRVQFDVAPSGEAVVVARHYQFIDPGNVPDEFLVDGRAVPPFESAVLVVPATGGAPAVLAHSKGDAWFLGPPAQGAQAAAREKGKRWTFGDPAVSPDGQWLALVVGEPNGETGMTGRFLLLFPLAGGADAQLRGLAAGDIGQPSWSPDSQRLVFTVRNEEGRHGLFVAALDGSEPQRFAVDSNYVSPSFSPQSGE